VPIKDQPLPTDASTTALSPGYVADSDTEEDPKEDPADYPTNKGNDDEEEEESSEDDDNEEEARKTVRLQPPMASSTKALIVDYSSVPTPTPPSPPPFLLSPYPTYVEAPLGYRVAMIQLRATSPPHVPSPPLLLPYANRKSDIPEIDMLFQKRLCLTAPAFRMEWQRQQAGDMLTSSFGCIHALEARDRALLNDLEDSDSSCVADALAEYETNISSRNGDDSHDSGSGRRTKRITPDCTYNDFLKCQSLNFKGLRELLTVGHDATYGMTWKILKKMMTDRNAGAIQRIVTCFECGVQEHYKKDCPKLKNNNHGNQGGNGGATRRAYAVGNA
nr:hypothetical protein [Tanacetum cinerariifolium]